MKFKIKLTSKHKIIETVTLTILDDLEFKLCKCRHIPEWESMILRNPEESSNRLFPWIFANTVAIYSGRITSSAFRLEYLTNVNSKFYLIESEK